VAFRLWLFPGLMYFLLPMLWAFGPLWKVTEHCYVTTSNDFKKYHETVKIISLRDNCWWILISGSWLLIEIEIKFVILWCFLDLCKVLTTIFKVTMHTKDHWEAYILSHFFHSDCLIFLKIYEDTTYKSD